MRNGAGVFVGGWGAQMMLKQRPRNYKQPTFSLPLHSLTLDKSSVQSEKPRIFVNTLFFHPTANHYWVSKGFNPLVGSSRGKAHRPTPLAGSLSGSAPQRVPPRFPYFGQSSRLLVETAIAPEDIAATMSSASVIIPPAIIGTARLRYRCAIAFGTSPGRTSR